MRRNSRSLSLYLICLLCPVCLLPLLPTAAVAQEPAQEQAERRTEAEIAYAYGLAALNDGDLDEAERELRQAVEIDPEHGGAWEALAEVAQARGDDAAARENRRRARRAAHSPDDRVSVQGLPRWEAQIGVSTSDDSNPANLPEATPGLLADGERLSGETSDGAVTADGRFEVHPFYDRNNWSLGVGASAGQSSYADLSALDRTVLRGFAHLSWGGDPLGYLTGPLGATRVPAGNRRAAWLLQAAVTDEEIDGEPYLDTLAAALAVTLREARFTATRLDVTYVDEDAERPDRVLIDFQDRYIGEREETSLGLSQFFYFGQRNRFLRLGARQTTSDAGGDFDAESTSYGAELAWSFGRRLFVRLAAEREDEDYDELESNPVFGSVFADRPRADTATRLSAAANVGLGGGFRLQVGAARLDRDIDLGAADQILDLDRDRTVVTVGLRWFVDGGKVQ